MPKISVILSAYNAEKFIAQSIESVLNQKFKDFEFLIVEDHSTDGTLQIIESYASEDSRINLVKKEKNKGFEGYVENLNLMIDQARGKYIAKFDEFTNSLYVFSIKESIDLEELIKDYELNKNITV